MQDRPPRRAGGRVSAGGVASAAGGVQGVQARLADLISVACDGEVSASRIARNASLSLTALGIGSLARLRLIDAIEDEFGLLVEADDILEALDSLSALADWLCRRLEDTQ
jgi:acyl carrier protein